MNWLEEIIPRKSHLFGCGLNDGVLPIEWCGDTCEQESKDEEERYHQLASGLWIDKTPTLERLNKLRYVKKDE